MLNPNFSVPYGCQYVGLDYAESAYSAELVHSSLGLVDSLDPSLCLVVPLFERLFERGEPRVKLHNTWESQLSAGFKSSIDRTCAIVRNRAVHG